MSSNDPPDRAGAGHGAPPRDSSRSEALEAELAALEALLPPEPSGAPATTAERPDSEQAAGKPDARDS